MPVIAIFFGIVIRMHFRNTSPGTSMRNICLLRASSISTGIRWWATSHSGNALDLIRQWAQLTRVVLDAQLG
jgi:hypothetical protein